MVLGLAILCVVVGAALTFLAYELLNYLEAPDPPLFSAVIVAVVGSLILFKVASTQDVEWGALFGFWGDVVMLIAAWCIGCWWIFFWKNR
jgi:hypothetical protein